MILIVSLFRTLLSPLEDNPEQMIFIFADSDAANKARIAAQEMMAEIEREMALAAFQSSASFCWKAARAISLSISAIISCAASSASSCASKAASSASISESL